MSLTTFLSNETLWQKLSHCIKTSRHVDAAIAYFGQGGAKLLPLRRGDRLIVDMSPATVRAGGTDPVDYPQLCVFRASLHIIAIGKPVIEARRPIKLLTFFKILRQDGFSGKTFNKFPRAPNSRHFHPHGQPGGAL